MSFILFYNCQPRMREKIFESSFKLLNKNCFDAKIKKREHELFDLIIKLIDEYECDDLVELLQRNDAKNARYYFSKLTGYPVTYSNRKELETNIEEVLGIQQRIALMSNFTGIK
mgnify:CR=1 FL=1